MLLHFHRPIIHRNLNEYINKRFAHAGIHPLDSLPTQYDTFLRIKNTIDSNTNNQISSTQIEKKTRIKYKQKLKLKQKYTQKLWLLKLMEEIETENMKLNEWLSESGRENKYAKLKPKLMHKIVAYTLFNNSKMTTVERCT